MASQRTFVLVVFRGTQSHLNLHVWAKCKYRIEIELQHRGPYFLLDLRKEILLMRFLQDVFIFEFSVLVKASVSKLSKRHKYMLVIRILTLFLF